MDFYFLINCSTSLYNRPEYICTIYQEKNFTKAAAKLMISQPALSATVRKVEEQLGLPLFDRSTKPISLTPAGEYYVQSAEKILGIVNDMHQYFDDILNLKTGKVIIGSSTFFCCFLLPPLIQKFKKQYPDIEVEVIEGDVSHLRKKLLNESIDLLLCISYEADAEIMDYIVWKDELLLLAVPASYNINHHLFDRRLTFSDVLNHKHLLPTCPKVSISHFKNESFLTLPKGNDIYKRTLAICQNENFTPTINKAPNQQLTAYHFVRAAMGVAFIREQLLYYINQTEDVYFYRIDTPLTERQICIAYKKNRILPIAISAFYKFLQTK